MINRMLADKISEFVQHLERIDTVPMDEFYDVFQVRLAHINELSIQVAENRSSIMSDFFEMTAPFFDLSEVVNRGRNKPLGYAGDYLTIDLIYQQVLSSTDSGGASGMNYFTGSMLRRR